MTKNKIQTYAIRSVYNVLTSSALKAFIIDRNVAPALVRYNRANADDFVGGLNVYAIKFATVGFFSYLIRAVGPAFQDQYVELVSEQQSDPMPLRYYTGALGGYFRYTAMGKAHPEIGAVNNLLYEVCNHHKLCAENPLVNTSFMIITEALDALAQDFSQGKLLTEIVIASATNGAMTGVIIAFLVHFVYTPLTIIKGVGENYLSKMLQANVDNNITQPDADINSCIAQLMGNCTDTCPADLVGNCTDTCPADLVGNCTDTCPAELE